MNKSTVLYYNWEEMGEGKHMDYRQQLNEKYARKTNNILTKLPRFCNQFFTEMKLSRQGSTQYQTACDLFVFFTYVHEFFPYGRKKEIVDYPLKILEQITAGDIEQFLVALRASWQGPSGHIYTNGPKAISRKSASITMLYEYFFRHQLIKTNPTVMIAKTKVPKKDYIVYLEPDEVQKFLEIVEDGKYANSSRHIKYKVRDIAMITLMLGTGIRVSECVGINIQDIDLKNAVIRIVRKGEKESNVYLSDEVIEALRPYYYNRLRMKDVIDKDAFFLSSHRVRMSTTNVNYLVKKYNSEVTTKNITTHKFRSTYGTSLYEQTGDIYLVASVLGHINVNTTKDYYVNVSDRKKQAARNIVKLKKK